MRKYAAFFSRLLKYLRIALNAFSVLIVLLINWFLALFVDVIYPGSRWWTLGALLIIETAAFFWLWGGWLKSEKEAKPESEEVR